jgi:hypothetical protein
MSSRKPIPKILYKYRDLADVNHQKLLFDRQLYFASAFQFNDPFDCTIPYRVSTRDLTPEKEFKMYLDVTKRAHPNVKDETELHTLAYAFQRKQLLHDDKHIETVAEGTVKEIGNFLGIVSLAEHDDLQLMWSHYSSTHKGFCIGFNSRGLYEETQAKFESVSYDTEFPEFTVGEDPDEFARKLTCTKSTIWAYEDEFRLTKWNMARKTQIISNECFEEIVLGLKVPVAEKFKLIEQLSKLYPHSKIFEMQKDANRFAIKRMQVF